MNTETLRSQLKTYEGFLSRDPDNYTLLGEVVDLNINLGHFERARNLLNDALKKDPANPGLIYREATLALAMGQPELAIEKLRGLMDQGIDAVAIKYNLAYAMMLARRFPQAKDILETIIASSDPLPEAYLLCARAMHHLGDIEKAITYAHRYAELRPDNSEVYGVIAMLHLDNLNKAEAKQWAEKAIQANPNNVEGLITLGSLALDTQEEILARDCFQRAIDRNPQSGRAWSGLGLTDMLDQNLPMAIEDLKMAVRLMPNHIGTWHALAWCHIVSNDLTAAKESLDKAMAIDHSFGETHGGLAVIAVMENRLPEAEDLIKRALRLDARSFSARFAQSLMLLRRDNPNAAQKLLERILMSPVMEEGESLRDILMRIRAQRVKNGKSS